MPHWKPHWRLMPADVQEQLHTYIEHPKGYQRSESGWRAVGFKPGHMAVPIGFTEIDNGYKTQCWLYDLGQCEPVAGKLAESRRKHWIDHMVINRVLRQWGQFLVKVVEDEDALLIECANILEDECQKLFTIGEFDFSKPQFGLKPFTTFELDEWIAQYVRQFADDLRAGKTVTVARSSY